MKKLSSEIKKGMKGNVLPILIIAFIFLIGLSLTVIIVCGEGNSSNSYSSYSGYSNSSSNSSNSNYSSYNSSKSNKSYSDAEVITATKFQVKKRLKAPSTAKFCKQNEISITRSSDSIVVTGYVDAENSFGATVRSYFTLTFTEDGSSLKDISID